MDVVYIVLNWLRISNYIDVPNGIFVHLFFAKLICLDLCFLPVYIVGV